MTHPINEKPIGDRLGKQTGSRTADDPRHGIASLHEQRSQRSTFNHTFGSYRDYLPDKPSPSPAQEKNYHCNYY